MKVHARTQLQRLAGRYARLCDTLVGARRVADRRLWVYSDGSGKLISG